MSDSSGRTTGSVVDRVGERVPWSGSRILALLAVALALGAPLRTMYYLSDVVGSPALFLAVAAASLLGATAFARVLRPTHAVGVGTALFAGGLAWYLTNLSSDPAAAALVADTLALLTGRSLLQIANVRLWVLSFAPAPVFLTWYFALRRWYATAVLAAGTALAFFALTTDAGLVTTLLGVVGSAAALGFGNLDTVAAAEEEDIPSAWPSDDRVRTSDTDDGIDDGRRAVLEQLAAIIVVPAVLSRLPIAGDSSLSFSEGTGERTVEGSLVSADESVPILGDISLTPARRYTVESEEPRHWRVASYDRYTGDGWVRTGNPRPYGVRSLDGPPGDTRTLTQEFEAESTIGTVPAAWKPVRYSGSPSVEVTNEGGLQPVRPLTAGERYQVSSEVLVSTPRQLRAAGTDYDDRIGEQFTQLPESTPSRVGERTAILTANAENPYETALVVEQWLANNREYSLSVDRPDHDVADAFLFEMDRGYCVYYATTMAVMLRTQGIPARMTVGYTPGERVDEDRWVVRGLNSHAWVEVYFPDHGWVSFDPTPSGPRDEARRQRIEETRTDDTGTVTASDEPPADTPTPTPDQPTETNGSQATPTATPTSNDGSPNRGAPGLGGGSGDDGGFSVPDLPSREEATLGVVALLGLAAGARRAGLTERAYRSVWLRYQRRESPEADVERAFQRVLYVLEARHRERRPGETVRGYLSAIDADERVRRLATLRERVRYSGEVDAAMAREAVDIADTVVSER